MGQNKVIFFSLCLMLAVAQNSHAGLLSDVLIPTPKKIEKRIKTDLPKIERQFKSDMQKIECISQGDISGARRLMKNDIRAAQKDVKAEARAIKQDLKEYKEKAKERLLNDYQKLKKFNDKVMNKAADLNKFANKPISKGMDAVMKTQPKSVRKLYKKYPGTTTLVLTGDTTAASAVMNAKKYEDPNSKTAGMDGILSTTYITHPAEYYNAQFFSGSSGEKTDTDGFNNFNERMVVGSGVGAARGASVGQQYGGAWGAIGGAIGGAINGQYFGTMTPDQSNSTTDQLALGHTSDVNNFCKVAGKVTGGIGGYNKAVPYINQYSPLTTQKVGDGGIISKPAPNPVQDIKNANGAAWESGHNGDYIGESSRNFGETMFGPTSLLKIGGTDNKIAKFVHETTGEVYEDTGVNTGRLIPRIGEKPYGN